jgi:alkylation response protein AidB-like acyl-CoA dehydrogenase
MTNRAIFEQDHNIFRENFRKFLEVEVKPHQEQWLKDRIVSREVWKKAGEQGFLCMYVDEKWGGLGLKDFRYSQIQIEEMSRIGESGFAMSLHSDVIGVYLDSFANDEQKARWMPGIISGEKILAVAMTEPGTGSDLKSIKTKVEDKGDYLLLNGAKTFISNGILSDIVIVAANWEGKGMTLVVVERGMEGFKRGRKLDKMGMHAQDTAELFFEDVQVPKANILGQPGMGFMYLMQKLAQERIVCAIGAISGARYAMEETLKYVKERKAFGKPIGSFQANRFTMAEMKTEVVIGETFVDQCVMKCVNGTITAEDAFMAKYWTTDLLNKVVYNGVQLHGGYGYMMEYPIARAYTDARITTIFAGTNEIMKEMIGRGMGL